jgi:hypothetical protein
MIDYNKLRNNLTTGTITKVAKEFKISCTLVSFIANGKRKPKDSLVLKRLIELAEANKLEMEIIKTKINKLAK